MNLRVGHHLLFVSVAFGFLALFASVVSTTTSIAQARPLQTVPTNVYVCDNNQPSHTCDNPNDIPLGPYAFESDYVATVLKNEWPQGGGYNYMQAFYAGAIAIRTFAQRNADGCGAISLVRSTYNGYPVLRNDSQTYFPRGNLGQYDIDAANNTAGLTILRFNDNAVGCAKYFADTGNPTGAFNDGGSPTDSVVSDTINISYSGHNPGMSQDGSTAWNRGASNVRLNWEQILGKYYTRIGLSTGTDNTGTPITKNNFRWTWTDVTTSVDYTAIDGNTYHSPKANTPTTLNPHCLYSTQFTVFNGSKVTFYANWVTGQPNPTRLSYHWFNDPQHAQVVVWDGDRSYLSNDLGFGKQQVVTAWFRTPDTAGTYYLTWDLVQENVAWYYDKNATRQDITVAVTGTPCP